MQNASKAYKDAMKKVPFRNLGYIKVYIGVVNAEAQKGAAAPINKNSFTYYTNNTSVFDGSIVDRVYATGEQDFSKVDGTMYFLPRDTENVIFNQGIVTQELEGSVYISLGSYGLDIKGLTINFGERYPIDFSVENDIGVHYYTDNIMQEWRTEDVFENSSYFRITAQRMSNTNGRLRINQFICGIANVFTNEDELSYTMKDYASPITGSIPSQDTTISVNNRSRYYNPDDPNSTLAFMEIGQEIKTYFGYELDDGAIEWLPPNVSYLKTWEADESQAKFTGTDIFDLLSGTYYKGIYRTQGISLYEQAQDILADAGIENYFLDPYLKKYTLYNPVPPVKHTDALQLIANAGRCSLLQERNGRICIKSSFIPDMVPSCNGETSFSQVKNILKNEEKTAYAMGSMDFSSVDDTLYFLPRKEAFLNTGYISQQIADQNGNFTIYPKITITLEAAFVAYGFLIRFRNITPQEFCIITYYETKQVEEICVSDPDLIYENQEQLKLFDKMEIIFSKGKANSRIIIDQIQIGDVTDYLLTPYENILDSPKGRRQDKIQKISVQRTMYRENEERKEITSEEIVVSANKDTYIVYFSAACYDLSANIIENSAISCEIIENSNYFAVLKFHGIVKECVIKYSIMGREYLTDKNLYSVQHNTKGSIIEWKNPLISNIEQAKDLEEWLAEYYLGEVEYSMKFRGDPRIDANDLFYLDLEDRGKVMVRGYENTLKFSGAWSGQLKARRVVLTNGNRKC